MDHFFLCAHQKEVHHTPNFDVSIAKYCPMGLLGGHFGSHLGFPMKIDDQHKFGTRHHTETNEPILKPIWA